jgi:hypothetical protein
LTQRKSETLDRALRSNALFLLLLVLVPSIAVLVLVLSIAVLVLVLVLDPSETVSVRWINRVNIDTIRFKLVFLFRLSSESLAAIDHERGVRDH